MPKERPESFYSIRPPDFFPFRFASRFVPNGDFVDFATEANGFCGCFGTKFKAMALKVHFM